MANEHEKQKQISNADTRARREWIESALDCVRRRMDASTFLPSTLESLGHEPAPLQSAEPPALSRRPKLYLAWSEGRRRPGA